MKQGGPYTVTDEEITVYAIWLKEGVGTVETPVINSGKHYDKITGGTNALIAANSAVTIQMSVTGVAPNLYNNRTISFNKNLEIGTTITMIDLSDTASRAYYYYKVTSATINSIPLTSFIKNGGSENYVEKTSEDEIEETFLFIIELPESETIGTNQVTLTRYSTDDEVAPIEQIVSYTTTAKRTFSLLYDSGTEENPTIESTVKFSYSSTSPVGADSYYNNKYAFLILTVNDGIMTEGTQIYDGTNYYNMNGNGQYIILLGSVSESKEKSLNLVSKTLNENEIECSLNAELWISANENSANPCMGEKVAEISDICFNSISLPAIKLEMSERIFVLDELSGNISTTYVTKNIEDYNNVTLELQKKISENSYETQTGGLTTVAGNSENTDGVFSLDLSSSGSINLKFGNSLDKGTYRILLKATDDNGKAFEIPYNFMIIE